jgi:hypothetical protein
VLHTHRAALLELLESCCRTSSVGVKRAIVQPGCRTTLQSTRTNPAHSRHCICRVTHGHGATAISPTAMLTGQQSARKAAGWHGSGALAFSGMLSHPESAHTGTPAQVHMDIGRKICAYWFASSWDRSRRSLTSVVSRNFPMAPAQQISVHSPGFLVDYLVRGPRH